MRHQCLKALKLFTKTNSNSLNSKHFSEKKRKEAKDKSKRRNWSFSWMFMINSDPTWVIELGFETFWHQNRLVLIKSSWFAWNWDFFNTFLNLERDNYLNGSYLKGSYYMTHHYMTHIYELSQQLENLFSSNKWTHEPMVRRRPQVPQDDGVYWSVLLSI